MVGVMSDAEALIAARGAAVGSAEEDDLRAAAAREVRRDYGTIVVIGGGCYGSYYVRQLGRAWSAGALRWQRLVVVDRDPECRVARAGATAEADSPHIIVSDWAEYLDRYLADAASDLSGADRDAIVPSPLMPHLAFEWLERQAKARWPHRVVERLPLDRAPDVPWQRPGTDGTHYVSFAEWMCPINCIEPARCPATRGPRSWSMPPTVRALVAAERERGVTLAGPLLFHCVHRAFGVGMFDSADLLAADAVVAATAAKSAAQFLVGTVSHCHGALGRLSIGE
jgi:hypothetical protein